jgi:adenylosuccinate synthase
MDEILGAQWGDEGKGKVVDLIAPDYTVVARFQGGPNAGHTLIVNGQKHVLHTLPSGAFRDSCKNLIGNGVVIDPVILKREIDALLAEGVDVRPRLFVSRRAHLILPTHAALDAASEAAKGTGKIGSTLKGIGPTYMDKTGRNGFRVGDLERPDMVTRYRTLIEKHQRLLGLYDHVPDWQSHEAEWLEAVEFLGTLQSVDGEYWLNRQLSIGHHVLAEGAQGTLLDIDFGTYPFVTSSSTVSAGACIGLGISPLRVGKVMGVFKAYCTRVGSGPFPTELADETGVRIREAGKEFGSTTGRPRRCGWLDLPALRYSVMINGITELIMTKADVLNGFDEIRVCVRYKVDGHVVDTVPYDMADAEPHYETMPGWDNVVSGHDLSKSLRKYIRLIEQYVGVPVSLVSTGPGRDEMLSLRDHSEYISGTLLEIGKESPNERRSC